MPHRWRIILLFLCGTLGATSLWAQVEESPIRIFGYFQTTFMFEHQSLNTCYAYFPEKDQTSIHLQHLNILMQKDLAEKWTSFIDMEFFNNYSSQRGWGAFNLQEVWVRYRAQKEMNLKIGLQVPTFNNLNEIKNRTPILPYIIRPLVYENSFSEFIRIEEYVPNRAFVQFYGFVPRHDLKFDYAFYLGNSPQISDRNDPLSPDDVTGLDMSDTFLVGGRIGFRYRDLKVGFSATQDYIDTFTQLSEITGEDVDKYNDAPRYRIGADASYTWNRFVLEGEVIDVSYDEKTDLVDADREFYYGTLGYFLTERLFVYGSYWYSEETNNVYFPDFEKFSRFDTRMKIPGGGISFHLSDRLTLKMQYAYVTIDNGYALQAEDGTIIPDENGEPTLHDITINHFTSAISVFF